MFYSYVLYLVVFCSDDDLEGYDKLVTGRRKTGRVSMGCSNLLNILFAIYLILLHNCLFCFSLFSRMYIYSCACVCTVESSQ